MSKTMAQVLEERGEARGEAKGRRLEKIETKQDDIIKLIRLKFEYVPENLIKGVKSINQIDQLDAFFESVFIAKTIDDVEIEE